MEYVLIFISAIFVNNIVLSQFLGICLSINRAFPRCSKSGYHILKHKRSLVRLNKCS